MKLRNKKTEPKDFWYIDYNGTLCNTLDEPVSPVFMCKEIGNYFETKEEAEKAVEKLKAWKRLEDKGFKFNGWNTSLGEISFEAPESFFPIKSYNISCITDETEDDLDLLFGGEE